MVASDHIANISSPWAFLLPQRTHTVCWSFVFIGVQWHSSGIIEFQTGLPTNPQRACLRSGTHRRLVVSSSFVHQAALTTQLAHPSPKPGCQAIVSMQLWIYAHQASPAALQRCTSERSSMTPPKYLRSSRARASAGTRGRSTVVEVLVGTVPYDVPYQV